MISIAAAGYGMMTHDRDHPQMVEQLRVILNVALNQEWQELMENRQSGAMAGSITCRGRLRTACWPVRRGRWSSRSSSSSRRL